MRKRKQNKLPFNFSRIPQYAILTFLWLLAITALTGGFLLIKPYLTSLSFKPVLAEEETTTPILEETTSPLLEEEPKPEQPIDIFTLETPTIIEEEEEITSPTPGEEPTTPIIEESINSSLEEETWPVVEEEDSAMEPTDPDPSIPAIPEEIAPVDLVLPTTESVLPKTPMMVVLPPSQPSRPLAVIIPEFIQPIIAPLPKEEEQIVIIPPDAGPGFWYQQQEKITTEVAKSKAVVNQIKQGIALIAKKTQQTTQQLVSPLTKVFLNKDQNLNKLAKVLDSMVSPIRTMLSKFKPKPKVIPTTELAKQEEPVKPEEIPTLVPKNLPNDVVLVKTRKGNLDLAKSGNIDLLAGMKAYSFIKPSTKPKKVIARLIFNQTLGEKKNEENPNQFGPWLLAKPAQAMSTAQAMDWQVFEKEYVPLKEDHDIYMAEIDVPQVAGHYTLQTEVVLEEGGSKLYDLKAEVEQRGYVYRQTNEGEIRLADVKVTLYNLDAKTGEYVVWPAGAYDQVNPQITSKTGVYFFMAPTGQYQLVAEKKGYEIVKKDIALDQPGPITKIIEMDKKGLFEWFK